VTKRKESFMSLPTVVKTCYGGNKYGRNRLGNNPNELAYF
jgi:hypothetical protein